MNSSSPHLVLCAVFLGAGLVNTVIWGCYLVRIGKDILG